MKRTPERREANGGYFLDGSKINETYQQVPYIQHKCKNTDNKTTFEQQT